MRLTVANVENMSPQEALKPILAPFVVLKPRQELRASIKVLLLIEVDHLHAELAKFNQQIEVLHDLLQL